MMIVNRSYNLSGAFWFIISLGIGVLNDFFSKLLIEDGLEPHLVVFLRMGVSSILLLPFIFYFREPLCIRHLGVHIVRGFSFAVGSFFWGYGLQISSLATGTLMGFTQPVFLLVLSLFFLKEQRTWSICLATFVSGIGVGIVHYDIVSNLLGAWVFLCSLFLFSFVDIVTKKYILEVSALGMLFFGNIFGFLAMSPLAFEKGIALTGAQLPYLFLLGLGGNTLLYALLKAYERASLLCLSPLAYLALLPAVALDFFYFGDVFSLQKLVGALIIISSSLFVSYRSCYEKK